MNDQKMRESIQDIASKTWAEVQKDIDSMPVELITILSKIGDLGQNIVRGIVCCNIAKKPIGIEHILESEPINLSIDEIDKLVFDFIGENKVHDMVVDYIKIIQSEHKDCDRAEHYAFSHLNDKGSDQTKLIRKTIEDLHKQLKK